MKLALIETPTNPGLEVCDIAAVAAKCRAARTILVADNTTATPLCQRPLDLGADISVMADTKAMAGHSDILAGHVASRRPELLEAVKSWKRLAGAIVSPFDAFLLHRGMETLELRIARANANALAVATALSGNPRVTNLRYPGLISDPAHTVARRQMTGYGPIVSFCLESRDAAEGFIRRHPCSPPQPASAGSIQPPNAVSAGATRCPKASSAWPAASSRWAIWWPQRSRHWTRTEFAGHGLQT